MKKFFSALCPQSLTDLMNSCFGLKAEADGEAFEVDMLDPEAVEQLSSLGLQIMFAGIALKVVVIVLGAH